MAIVLHRNRILVRGFKEDSFDEFVKKNTVFAKKITFGYEELWTALAQVNYNGESYYAIPRNFPPKYLMKYLEEDEKEIIKEPEYFIPRGKCNIALKPGVSARSELQLTLSDFLHGKNDFSDIKDKPRRAMFVDTGEGKTFVTISYICASKQMAGIICPDDRAITTWLEEFDKFSDIDIASEVAIVKGSASIKKIIENKSQYKLMICSAPTLSSIFKNGDAELVTKLFEELKISVKIIDEMHLKLQTIFNLEMHVVSYKTLYLTATDSRRIYGEQIILQNMTPGDECVYRQDKVEKFDFVEVQYYSNAAKEHQKGINKPNGFDALVYLKMLTHPDLPYFDFFCKEVLRRTVNYALKHRTAETNKIAVIVKTNEAGRAIGEYLIQQYPDLTVGFFNSDIKDMDERMKETDKNLIITTDKSFSGIINISCLEMIINVTPITSEAHLLQIAGRLRKEGDKKRMFIQLADFTFKKCRNMMYRERKVMDPVSVSYTKFVVGKPTRKVDEDDE
jgi:hypothetical protein